MGRKNDRYKTKFKNKKKPWNEQRQRFTATTSASKVDDMHRSESDSHSHSDVGESDIPGYYYDPEKKTYFKILPNHLGCGGSFVTKDVIKKNKTQNQLPECKRNTTKSKTATLSSIRLTRKRPKNSLPQSIMSSIVCAQTGQAAGKTFENHVMRLRYSQMHRHSNWGESEVFLPNFGVHLEAFQRMELNSRRDKAVCVWSVEMDMSQKIQLMSISYNRNSKMLSEDNGCFPVRIQPSQSYGVTCSSKISSLCWSPLSFQPGKSCVLYTTIFPLGDSNSKVSISNLQAKEREEVNIFDFSLGRGAVWSSAWNRANNRFSVGCERKCQVVDVRARRQWFYSTGNSDVLSQLFSVENPHLLYSGTRSGAILMHDLRGASHGQFFSKLNQKMPVICIRSPKDENYLFASDFSGLICLWDLRMQKTVLKYSGLVNSHYQLPFYLDETEQFVYGTGSDGYCKLWDRFTGSVVTTIAPPLPDAQPGCLPVFPITHFSRKWSGHLGITGAITVMGRKFFLSQ